MTSLDQLDGWSYWALNAVTVGSAIAVSKLIFLPFYRQSNGELSSLPTFQSTTNSEASPAKKSLTATARFALMLLLGGLFVASALQPESYTFEKLASALGKGGLGMLFYFVWARRQTFRFSRTPEKLEHLLGVMVLMLTLLFWMVVASGSASAAYERLIG